MKKKLNLKDGTKVLIKRLTIEDLDKSVRFSGLCRKLNSLISRPTRWGGQFAIGHDRRARGTLGDGDPDSGTGDPRFWFAEPNDVLFSAKLWSQWKT